MVLSTTDPKLFLQESVLQDESESCLDYGKSIPGEHGHPLAGTSTLPFQIPHHDIPGEIQAPWNPIF